MTATRADSAGVPAATGVGCAVPSSAAHTAARCGAFVGHLRLTDFRNHALIELAPGPRPVVLFGPNGAGKTNILEALSLLAPGQGLRRALYPDMVRIGAVSGWAISARVEIDGIPSQIGTGFPPQDATRTGRLVRIDGEMHRSSGALAGLLDMVWLTPASDGVFTGAAGDRRRFFDRLVISFDPGHGVRSGQYERAMRQRNRLLEVGGRAAEFEGLEQVLAETGVAIAAARLALAESLTRTIAARKSGNPDSAFPWADLVLEGDLETALMALPAVDVEDRYLRQLRDGRPRDQAAKRTLVGPHRSDLAVRHGPKDMPARFCSTGEQKALLIGLVLAHAELRRIEAGGRSPILLLDEIAAHLDPDRRAALFSELIRLGTQAWMTGTDLAPFEALGGQTDAFRIDNGRADRSAFAREPR